MGVAETPLRNARLEKVAQELAKLKSPVEASKVAGYKPGSSFDSNARKRAQHPQVRARIEYLQRISGVVAAADSAFVQRELMEIASISFDAEEITVDNKLKALDMLSKINGLYAPAKVAATDSQGNDTPVQVIEIVRFAENAKDKAPA